MMKECDRVAGDAKRGDDLMGQLSIGCRCRAHINAPYQLNIPENLPKLFSFDCLLLYKNN